MGNKSNTKSTADIENKLSYDTRKKIENVCSVGNTTSNAVTISGSKLSNVNVDMANQVTSSCKMRAALNDLLQTDSQIDVAQMIAESQLKKGLFGSNKSNTELTTLVSNRVGVKSTLEVINRCMQKVDLTNILTITNSTVADSKFKMQNTAFNDCLQESLLDLANKNGFASEAEDVVKKHQVEESPSLFGGMLMKIIVMILLGIAVIYLILRFICRSKFKFLPPWLMVCRFVPFTN